MRFKDRRHAGEILGATLARMDPDDPVVYALPRGGVPVGVEVANALDCPLDVLVVRKIGVPFQPELAMGAIAERGVIVRNSDVISQAMIDEDEFAAVVRHERRELERRVATYRVGAEPVPASGRTALIVDDGLATGSTAQAAVAVLQKMGASEVWVAVPVAPRDTAARLAKTADRVVVLEQPASFGAVGSWYRDFTQTSDDEVRSLLAGSRLR
jgi:putative phosphoribosyl transferase